MRYVIVHATEDGPVVTSPLGGVLLYSTQEEATLVARRKSLDGTRYYVQKLITVSTHKEHNWNGLV